MFAGEYEAVELPTLEVEWRRTVVAVNDVVVTSSTLGRMVELEWAIGGEDLGGSRATASSAHPIRLDRVQPLERRAGARVGFDALAITFVAPHSLHARPIVVPRGLDVVGRNRDRRRSPQPCSPTVIQSTSSQPGDRVVARLSDSAVSSRPFRRARSSAGTGGSSRPESARFGTIRWHPVRRGPGTVPNPHPPRGARERAEPGRRVRFGGSPRARGRTSKPCYGACASRTSS